MEELNEIIKLHKLGKLKIAKEEYLKFIDLHPNNSDVYTFLGLLTYEYEKDLKKAINYFDQSLKLNKKNINALINRASLNFILGNINECIEDLTLSLTIDDKNYYAFNNLGAAYKKKGLMENAIGAFTEAIKINNDYLDAYYNRGTTYSRINKFDNAIDDLNQIIKRNPKYSNAYLARGNAFKNKKEFEKSIHDYDLAALDIKTRKAALLNKATLLLLLGNFEKGFDLFENRWGGPLKEKKFIQPLWNGKDDLKGKSLLIHCEQGLGDTIQFSRYVKEFDNYNCHLVLEVQKPLLKLLSSLTGVSKIIEKDQNKPLTDYHIPLMSLPRVFGTNIKNIKYTKGYLSNDKNLIKKWENILGPKTKPRVGICWSGNPKHFDDHNRSARLRNFADVLNYNQYEWISLNDKYHEDDIVEIQKYAIRDMSSRLSDFSETGALIENLDFIISVDTAVAHCAGALGKKVILMLPSIPDWRWQIDLDTSIWYKNFSIIRKDNYDTRWASLFLKAQLNLVKNEYI